MKNMSLKPWSELPDWYRQALVAELLEDWPKKDHEAKELMMSGDPDRVKAAGLWPGLEHLAEVFDEVPAPEPAGALKKPGSPAWHELREDLRLELCNSLLRDWPMMSEDFRREIMHKDPDRVKAAGLWPEGEG